MRQVTPGNPSNATVLDGALVLERPARAEPPLLPGLFNGADASVSQNGLRGDFDITVVWEDFQPGDAEPFIGARVEAGVWREDLANGVLVQATATVGRATGTATVVQDGEIAIDYLEPTPSPESLVGASGTFHITRTGGVATVESTVNGQTASMQSSSSFTEEPLILFLSINMSGEEEAMEASSIKISSVTVNGGGGLVKSDDFSCP